VNSTKHNEEGGAKENTIKKFLVKKCPHYYEFDEVMNDSSIVAPPYLIEFTRPDVISSKEGTEDEEEQEKRQRRKQKKEQEKRQRRRQKEKQRDRRDNEQEMNDDDYQV
jgi:hypothetical protein